MLPAPSRRGRARAAGLALLLAGCSSVDARVHNLRELHHDDGRPSYRAALVSETGYEWRAAFRVQAPLGLELELPDVEEEAVKNPSRRCLENLRAMAGFDGRDPRVRALQVELYAWLASSDAYLLARERALVELGPLARRLGVRERARALEPGPAPAELEELALAVVAAARPLLRGEAGEVERRAFADACAALAAPEHDLSSGRRALRVTAALLGARGASRKAFDPLRAAAAALERRLAALAMTSALEDPVPWVRAAAVDAWVEATDNDAAEVLALALATGDPEGSDVVRLRALTALAERGLPASERGDAARDAWVARLVELAQPGGSGAVHAAACRALARVSGAGFASLRFDDWLGWWRARLEREAQAAGTEASS